MKKITSSDNKTFKMCIQLQRRKYRDKLSKYMIEGPNLIEEALKNNVLPEFILVEQGQTWNLEIKQICEKFDEKTRATKTEKIWSLEKNLFEKLSQTQNSQGILGIVEKCFFTEEMFFNHPKSRNGNILVLDRLQDPGNVGTIIRTADAAGYDGIMVLKGTVDIFSPKVVRACTGSLFRMPFLVADSAEHAIQILKKNGKRIVSTGFETDKYYYEADLKKNIALVIGNEGNGICETFKSLSDEVIKIPMSGSIESLNASVAAAILMYEAMRH